MTTRPQPADVRADITADELLHLWNDPNVSDASRQGIIDGTIHNYASCPADVVQSLSAWFDEASETESATVTTPEDFAELFGIGEVVPTQKPKLDSDGNPILDKEGNPETTAVMPRYQFSSGTGRGEEVQRWTSQKNLRNRKRSDDSVKRIREDVAAGLYAYNGEPIIFDATGQIISGQHQMVAWWQAIQAGEVDLSETPFRKLIVYNVPGLLADTIDRARARSVADQLLRDNEVLAVDSLVGSDGQPMRPQDAEAARYSFGRPLQSCLTALQYRLSGKNIKASGAKAEASKFLHDRFDGSLDRLINVVGNHSSTKVGPSTNAFGFVSTAGIGNLAAAIVLCELADTEPLYVVDDKGRRYFSRPTADQLGELSVNADRWDDLIKDAIAALSDSEHQHYAALSAFRDANGKSSAKQSPEYKFASVCAIVADLAGADLHGFVPRSDNAPSIPREGTVGTKGRGKDRKTSYPFFGGADVGPNYSDE